MGTKKLSAFSLAVSRKEFFLVLLGVRGDGVSIPPEGAKLGLRMPFLEFPGQKFIFIYQKFK